MKFPILKDIGSGHLYFTLKDENAVIKAVMFKFAADTIKFEPKEGDKVEVLGKISIYPKSGSYQIYVQSMRIAGIGDLYQKFEELKQKLEKEGLFSEQHKKAIPFMPKIVGVLTSNTGSVIKDIISVSTRRNKGVYIRLLPVPVQGDGAGERIARGIEFMNKHKLADVLIIGRGGGSIEDLWPFNEEVLARAIYESEIPIISAVGHDTDYTIADFVADKRAPTPSAAAEIAVPDVEKIKRDILKETLRLRRSLIGRFENLKLQYQKNFHKLRNPINIINEKRMHIDYLNTNIQNALEKNITNLRNRLENNESKIKLLNPLNILDKGYTLVEIDGIPVKDSKTLKKGDKVDIRFKSETKAAEILK